MCILLYVQLIGGGLASLMGTGHLKMQECQDDIM